MLRAGLDADFSLCLKLPLYCHVLNEWEYPVAGEPTRFSIYMHCLLSFSWPTETALIPLHLLCHSPVCQTCKKGIFWQRTTLAKIVAIHLVWSDDIDDIDYGSTGFLLNTIQDACMHTVCALFNHLMGLRGLQPDALMIIFCEVVVMVWPQRQQLLRCLHMPLDQFGCVYFAAMLIIYQDLQG